MKEILNQLRESIKKKKENIIKEFENHILAKKPNHVYDESVPISKRIFVPGSVITQEENKKKEVDIEKSSLLDKYKDSRDVNNTMETFSIEQKYQVKDKEGNVVVNPSVEDVDDIHNDNVLINIVTELKNQKHLTKSNLKGKNLDDTHDNIFDILKESRKVFSEAQSFEEVKELIDDSLKISEARGIVVHQQNVMFQDYCSVRKEEYEDLGINAVNLTKDITVNSDNSPNAKVFCHSSLYNTNLGSFTNSAELVTSKLIASKYDTEVFVTGDVSKDDSEVQKFIGNHRLIVLEDTEQTNYDCYMRCTLLNGESVVVGIDFKNRPVERIDNMGEINNSDPHTFMYHGEVLDKSFRDKKFENLCDKQINILYNTITELKNQTDYSKNNLAKFEVRIAELQIEQLKTARISHDIADLDSFHGVKSIFHEFINEAKEETKNNDDDIDWIDLSLDSSKIVD